jgi:two-component system phosphate regulon sensor histidine kinase PhoR
VIAIAVGALLSLGVGLAAGPEAGWAAFSLVLLAILLYHLRHLHGLKRWLELGDSPDPPRAHGLWDRVHAHLHRSRRESGKREADLVHALSRWREAARALPDGVVILEDGRIEWCNDTARLHLHLDLAQDAGRPITHLVRIPAFTEYLEAGDFAKPVQVISPHAGERVLSLQVIPYGEAQSLVLSRDITQFQRVERMRREFVANVSHELRTPLTVISGFIETLRDEKDPENTRRFLDLMATQAARMQRLVEDLLTLSALESSPPPPMEEPVAMAGMVERLAAEARALSGGRHRIETQVEPGLDLLGSEKELASAFGNLVSNAIRYTSEGGQVTLRWRATADGAAFDVVDSGIGSPPEHIPRLTERFYRVDRGRSRETGGTGLGLAIVKHALGRHGAALQVTSAPGQGSTFSAQFSGPRLKPVSSRN